jgi:hypothetical protein
MRPTRIANAMGSVHAACAPVTATALQDADANASAATDAMPRRRTKMTTKTPIQATKDDPFLGN